MLGIRRGTTEIIGDMLNCLAREKLKATHLMLKAKIDTRTFLKYIYLLLESGLVERDEENYFMITDQGVDFLVNLGKMQKLLIKLS